MPPSASLASSVGNELLHRNPWDELANSAAHSAEEYPQNGQSSMSGSGMRTSHVRAHTTAGHPLHASSPSEWHDNFIDECPSDLHDTRPSLRRAINSGLHMTDQSTESRPCKNARSSAKDSNAEVIVHQVQPTDSLAGVALKYNISIAALRSTNKLWTNDSIHLREVLYIPVHAVRKRAQNRVDANFKGHRRSPSSTSESDLHIGVNLHKRSGAFQRDSTDHLEANTPVPVPYTISAGTNSVIKRIPLSELSFFPPSSTSSSSRPPRTGPRTLSRPLSPPSRSMTANLTLSRGQSAHTAFFSGPSERTVNGTPTVGLSTFFYGAKDEIISRLSFDSIRGSSDSTDDPDVELDVVKPSAASNRRNTLNTPGRERGSLPESDRKIMSKAVETLQPRPSPSMEIPSTARAGVTSSQGTAIQNLFGKDQP